MAEGFAAIPTWMIRDESVSIFAIAVYLSLASRNGLQGIFPSQGTIARESRCSERKVRDALNELENLGVVERVRRKNSLGRATNAYVLLSAPRPGEVAAPLAVTAEVAAPGDRGSGISEQPIPLIEADIDEADICASAHSESAHSFDEWWKIYPLKKDKGRARTAWKSALKKTSAEVLLSAAMAYRDDPNRNPSFTKYPASWLNAEAWENGPLPQRAINPTGGTAVERMAATARAMQQEGGRRELVG